MSFLNAREHDEGTWLDRSAGLVMWEGSRVVSTFVVAVASVWGAAASQPAVTEQDGPQPTAPQRQVDGQDAPSEDEEDGLTEDELERIRVYYEEADEVTRQELEAYYEDLYDITLQEVLGISQARQKWQGRSRQVIAVLADLSISRTPDRVLHERALLAGPRSMPNPETASGHAIASWIVRHAVAGEWGSIGSLMLRYPEPEARSITLQLYNSLSSGDHNLRPEDVLTVADVLPGTPDRVHLVPLSRLLAQAVQENDSSELLRLIREGTRHFGRTDEETRRRTVTLLSLAGLYEHAYEFLDPLDRARADSDAEAILTHGMYLVQLAERSASGPVVDGYRRRAFEILAEVPALDSASPEQVRASIESNIALLPEIPRPISDPWLTDVIERHGLIELTAEILAKRATTVGASMQERRSRAEAMSSFSHAVEIMLRPGTRDSLAIPLTILADALSDEIERTLDGLLDEEVRRYERDASIRDLRRLLNAAPSEVWLGTIDRTSSIRASRIIMGASIALGDTDRAIRVLREVASRSPEAGRTMAEEFLDTWGRYLRSNLSGVLHVYDWGWSYAQSGVLTRGQQRRRLEALREVLEVARELGLEPARLRSTAELFSASHQPDEIYRREDIETVFGAIESIPPLTAARLADAMRERILRYWETRIRPPGDGKPATPRTEIVRIVNLGYDTALELLDAAEAQSADLWDVHAVRASVSYDRLQLNKRIGAISPGQEFELTSLAFIAFEQAAGSYAESLRAGQSIESADIYGRWFRAAMGASDVSRLGAETLSGDAGFGKDQFARIASRLDDLPAEAADRHIESLVAELIEAYDRAPPEVRPRLLRHAVRVAGDHPAAGPLREMVRVHEEYASSELKLRLVVDGSPRVEEDRAFLAMLSFRYTNAVQQSAGDLSRFLPDPRSSFRRDRSSALERAVQSAFSKGFDVDLIHLFDAGSVLPYGVVEDGEDGWLELPLAMVYARPNDSSIDRLPRVEMEVSLNDSSGEVVVVLSSNAQPISVVSEAAPRLVQDLQVTQTLDARGISGKDAPVVLEVTAVGRGVVPDLDDLLVGLDEAAGGYRLDREAIEAGKVAVIPEPPPDPDTETSVTPPIDELGVLRPTTERTWILSYTPEQSATDGRFLLPELVSELEGTLVSQQYGDTDIFAVSGGVAELARSSSWRVPTIAAGAAAVGAALGIWTMIVRRRSSETVTDSNPQPIRQTATGAIYALRELLADAERRSDQTRVRQLAADIATIEQTFFSGPPNQDASGKLSEIVSRWSSSSSMG